jgi:hypothetical protein
MSGFSQDSFQIGGQTLVFQSTIGEGLKLDTGSLIFISQILFSHFLACSRASLLLFHFKISFINISTSHKSSLKVQ